MHPGNAGRCLGGALLLLAGCLAAGCDSDPLIELPPDTRVLAPQAEAELSVAGIQLRVDSIGTVKRGRWGHSIYNNFLFDSGLWLAGYQAGELRASLHVRGTSNYRLAPKTGGVYLVEPEDLEGPVANWPADAPRDVLGSPRLFGDAMVWAQYVPHPRPKEPDGWPSVDLYATPLEDLTISLAVYGYDDPRLDNVVFLRYEMHNAGEAPIEDAYVGFQTDVDLQVLGCASAGNNSTGYLSGTSTTYIYPHESRGDVVAHATCPTPVVGYTFLESPVRRPGADAVTSHPIYRKNNYVDFTFSEIATTVPQEAYWLLQGRSTTGHPMIDPTTDRETLFAFTGNPMAEDGWLDVAIDVRGLLAAGPFTLAPDQTHVLTVVFVVTEGAVLSGAMKRLHSRMQFLRNTPTYWEF